MPRLRLALFALAAAVSLAACQKATPEQCEHVCWHFNELHYWEQFAADSRDSTPEAREKLRAERQKAWQETRARAFDPGLENCVKACRVGASPDDVACAERATTSRAAQACLK